MSIFDKLLIKAGMATEVPDEQAPAKNPNRRIDPTKPITPQLTEDPKPKIYGDDEEAVKNYVAPPSRTGSTTPATTDSEVHLTDLSQHFIQMMKDKNLPGPDFYEFQQMKDSMSALPVEETKYVAAFQGLSTQGLTKEILLSSATQYQDFIKQEIANFGEAFEVQLKAQVTDKKADIQAKSDQIKKLAEQMKALNDEITKSSSEVTQNERHLRDTKADFEAAGQNMINKINVEVENINNYIH